MNYIGSKYKLSDFIKTSVQETVGSTLTSKVFCDLFAGTGIIGRSFKTLVKQVISNDLEYYSYALNRNYIGNYVSIEASDYVTELNQLEGKEGFVYKNYCTGGTSERMYFSNINGCKIDAARMQIENWKKSREINEDTYYFLLASLLESADKVANTASVYGSYLKELKKTAQKEIKIISADFEITENQHEVYNQDSNALIKKIEGDILYLDPPYNARQYGANYHILNTIAKYDTFVPAGKTGLRPYERSNYCKKGEVALVFEELIRNAKFNYIFLSYNNEGLMTEKEIRQIMKRYGRYDLVTTAYQRFKADKTENRNHKATKTTEYLHILEK
ncbi:DNA adenine methylase [uncultured Aquimarina sp.]|uniref:DNA adenine methylase n=1 Tax=uncultured Aquimarina sp. TaxID=575652 RepID=UPI00261B8484|nr:DNA adenine methylase [uncultured Aquimarina sp.]